MGQENKWRERKETSSDTTSWRLCLLGDSFSLVSEKSPECQSPSVCLSDWLTLCTENGTLLSLFVVQGSDKADASSSFYRVLSFSFFFLVTEIYVSLTDYSFSLSSSSSSSASTPFCQCLTTSYLILGKVKAISQSVRHIHYLWFCCVVKWYKFGQQITISPLLCLIIS